MTDHAATPTRADLRDFVGPVLRRKWLVLAIIVLSTVATYTLSDRQERRYRSSTQVFVAASTLDALVNGPTSGTDRNTLDQAQLVRSRSVTKGVIKRLGLAETPDALVGSVKATPTPGSNFVVVSVERSSGAQAAAIANAYVKEYIAYRGLQVARDVAPALRAARKQLAGLPKTDAASQDRKDARDAISQLQKIRDIAPTQVRQTDLALAPTQPFTPRPKRDAAFGFVISLALALGLAFVLERFDRRITRPEEVTAAYDVPLLAVIPHSQQPMQVRDGDPAVPDALREPFRGLRSSLQFASLDKPVRCLAVTSAISGEGKSTIIRNLALTYHEWGLNVVVVEADLRRPTLSSLFGVVATELGLTAVLTGEVTLDDALQDIEVEHAGIDYLNKVRAAGSSGQRQLGEAGAPKLALLSSGKTPPNPQAVLSTDTTRQVIDQLGRRFDMVLVDTPPLLAVSDAYPILSQSDGVVIVARIGLSDRGSAARAMEAARRVPDATILGVVANDLPFEIGYGYGYGYQAYGYGSNGSKAKN
jgi:succinoglycan biosynthesis transport protein ExoP